MGRLVGIEPTHAGATIQCVNRFTKAAIMARIHEPLNQQRPILPARLQTSTFGVRMLNYCVRHGNRWNHPAIVTEYSFFKDLYLENYTEEIETTF